MPDGCAKKKLREAARYLCGARPPADTGVVARDLAGFGATPEDVERWKAATEEQPFAVLPECWPAVELFMLSMTQWRAAGMNGALFGLDYAGVQAAWELSALSSQLSAEERAAVFADLRVMEAAAVAFFAERRQH